MSLSELAVRHAASVRRNLRVSAPVSSRGVASRDIGNAFVARATPDGHTPLMGLSCMTLVPAGPP